MRSPFQSFPQRPPARVLLYGDPGTEKTRRALSQMPGPVALVDLEAGATYYQGLASEGCVYMSTRSIRDLEAALAWLESPDAKAIRTVVIDPITVVWEQLQEGHRQKTAAKKKQAPEEVLFDVGTWGRLTAVHGALMTRIINLSQHVVITARGKEAIDEGGNAKSYSATCQKAVPFLVSTVIQTRHGFDVVEKDRSGTLREGKQPRVDLSVVVKGSGSTVTRMEPETAAAERDATETPATGREPAFVGAIEKLGHDYDRVREWVIESGDGDPDTMTVEDRRKLYATLKTPEVRATFTAWLDARDAREGA